MTRAMTLAALLLAPAVCAAEKPGPLDWLGGRWCAAAGEEFIEELWLPPAGNTMLGMSRTYTNSTTVSFEYLRIVERDGVLEYLAQPGGRAPTAFTLVEAGEQWIRFENAGHDFPQRIEYRRDGELLHAEIAGLGEDGDEFVIPFEYRSCGD
jgi:Domain of unknown function (DUF6265)